MAENNTTAPKVFFSYSHDNSTYKDWIRNFADRLRVEGIDVLLDQYELKLGSSNTHFMEESIENSDFVLLFLSKKYVEKANKRKGGAGYETQMVTGNIITEKNKEKFIPILIDIEFNEVPTYLSGTNAIKIESLFDYNSEYDEIYKVITGQTIIKPKLGEIRKIDILSEEIQSDIKSFPETHEYYIILELMIEVPGLRKKTLPELYNLYRTRGNDLKGLYVFNDSYKKSHDGSIVYESNDYQQFTNCSRYEKLIFNKHYINYTYFESHDDKPLYLDGLNVFSSITSLFELIKKAITWEQTLQNVNTVTKVDSNVFTQIILPDLFTHSHRIMESYSTADKKSNIGYNFLKIDSDEYINYFNRFLGLFVSNNKNTDIPFLRIEKSALTKFYDSLIYR